MIGDGSQIILYEKRRELKYQTFTSPYISQMIMH